MAKQLTVEVVEVVTNEIAIAEAQLKAAEPAKIEAYRRANDPGEKSGQLTWARLPLPEPEATALKSAADYSVTMAERELAAARRPKIPADQARELLTAAEGRRAALRAKLGQLQDDRASSDPFRRKAAPRAAVKETIDLMLEAEDDVEVARLTLRDSEQREIDQRLTLFEVRATALARQIDGHLDALMALVTDAVTLGEQARAAGCSFDPPTFLGALPERVECWRAEQKTLGRL